jgi:glycine dehydrogenase
MTIQAHHDSYEQFADRHIGPNTSDLTKILSFIGYSTLDDLSNAAVPINIQNPAPLAIADGVSESEVLAELKAFADANEVLTSMIGLGYYGTHTPGVILRNITENPAWYTAYTPYQPEIAQGRLEALINFQTMVTDLTGLDIASASLLDESTAAAEAMTLMRRSSKSESNVFVVDADTHPQTLAVLATRAEPIGIELVLIDVDSQPIPESFGALLSYPGSSGKVRNLEPIITAAKSAGVLIGVTTDLLALTLLKSPGELGADIAVGSSQRFGVPMGFGGPHAGFMSVRNGLERSLPGRLVGVSVDADGNKAYRLALQTREQHIRRDKATSNICTAQVLLAVMASMYAVYHGPVGLRRIARNVHRRANALADGIAQGLSQTAGATVSSEFFDTIRVSVPGKARAVVAAARTRGITVWEVDSDTISLSVDETTTTLTIEQVWAAFSDATGGVFPTAYSPAMEGETLLSILHRESAFLEHPVFNSHQSETEMLRYIRRLSDKDIALDRSMIPLGSCTMKLNGTTEMESITWPEFAGIHPFAPLDSVTGYLAMIRELEDWLIEVTGYDAVSLQPNAGSQGEFAGLLAIRGYHKSRGDSQRNVCLIPSSAHGTNAASAVMAGMRVVVVGCDDFGNVDMDDLKHKILEHESTLAALMITYPSTHGVYEASVSDICAMIHDAGGQVYVDGANLNALVGLAKPGKFGADVSHLNLHKTFAIPHGGGGPGVGPVGVRTHLAPFLPSHPLRPEAGPSARGYADGGVGAVSGAPWGSAGILPIPWAYIRLMGGPGLTKATQVAVASGNYIAKHLSQDYPILYVGANGLVAHECILDLREITKESGVTIDDVAKRLVDYGFHAPTMSFPVAGTFMVEPTESESLFELDRFIEAMKSIKQEINLVSAGTWPVDDNPLHNAPHTATYLMADWDHPYSREQAAYPVARLRENKYWPTVRRVDGAYGDRNLVCACPPISDFAE